MNKKLPLRRDISQYIITKCYHLILICDISSSICIGEGLRDVLTKVCLETRTILSYFIFYFFLQAFVSIYLLNILHVVRKNFQRFTFSRLRPKCFDSVMHRVWRISPTMWVLSQIQKITSQKTVSWATRMCNCCRAGKTCCRSKWKKIFFWL